MKTLLLASILTLELFSQVSAQPFIDSILINGKCVQLHDNLLTVGVAQDRLDIFFTPDTANNTQYIFFLAGFEQDTVCYFYPIASYTNLTGGNYTFWYFTLKNGVKSAPHSLRIHVDPSLLESWWFWPSLSFYLFLLFLMAAYFVRINNSRNKATLQATRTQIAQDLHDEVGTTLNGVGMAINRMQRSSALVPLNLISTLDTIKTDIRIVIEKLRDAVWAITPDSDDDFHTLLDKVCDFAFKIFENKNIAFDFDNQLNLNEKVKLRMEQRHNVHLILKEAVNNIAKHAEASEAYLYVKRAKDGIEIKIGDNGKGFNTQETYAGNGLKNFRKRAEDSFAELHIQSEPGRGTHFVILVPEI